MNREKNQEDSSELKIFHIINVKRKKAEELKQTFSHTTKGETQKSR